MSGIVRTLTERDLPAPPAGKRGWPWSVSGRAFTDNPDSDGLPTMGIVTPSLNQGPYLEAAIRSVLLQGYPRVEYYVMDGGSQDETREILDKYEPFLSGSKSLRDRGQADAVNMGFGRLQQATWVTWLNSDDMLAQGALFEVARWTQRNSSAIAVIGEGIVTDSGDQILYAKRPPADLNGASIRRWKRYEFCQPSCFFSKRAFDDVGGLNIELDCAVDFDLWVRLGEIGDFDTLGTCLSICRAHPCAKTQTMMPRCFAETVAILFRRGYYEEGMELIAELYEEVEAVHRAFRPLTRTTMYRRALRPILKKLLDNRVFRD